MSDSHPDRIAVLIHLLRQVSSATDPREVLREYSRAIERRFGRSVWSVYISLSCRDLEPGAYRITRRLDRDHLDQIHASNPWRDRDRLEVHTGGLLGEIVTHGQPVRRGDLDARDDPVLGDALAGHRSLMAVPLFDDGAALNWAIELREEPDAYSADQLEDMLMHANLIGGTVRLVQTAQQLEKAHDTIRHEVQKIGDIQRALLPSALPDVHGCTVAATYDTFDQAGGDYYNVHPLGISGLLEGEHDGRWGMMVADVSGHGPAAAVVMAMLQAILMCLPVENQDSATVCEFLNRHLCTKRIDQTFVTAFVIGYDPQDGRLWYARAGHPPAMVRRLHGKPGGETEVEIITLDAVGGVPLGILEDATYDNADFQLQPGDTVVMYTDGIAEARSPDGKFFGEEGIKAALRACSGEADCFIRTLRAHLLRHEGGERPQDDQTALAFRVESIGARPATFTPLRDGAGI